MNIIRSPLKFVTFFKYSSSSTSIYLVLVSVLVSVDENPISPIPGIAIFPEFIFIFLLLINFDIFLSINSIITLNNIHKLTNNITTMINKIIVDLTSIEDIKLPIIFIVESIAGNELLAIGVDMSILIKYLYFIIRNIIIFTIEYVPRK